MLDINAAINFQPPSLLIKRFCDEHDVSESEAQERFEETKKFLVMCADDRQAGLVPSKKIDAVWHQFILFSRDYFSFCELLGGYIHHQPSEVPQPNGYVETLERLKRNYGSINPKYWDREFAEGKDCSSGSCDCCP